MKLVLHLRSSILRCSECTSLHSLHVLCSREVGQSTSLILRQKNIVQKCSTSPHPDRQLAIWRSSYQQTRHEHDLRPGCIHKIETPANSIDGTKLQPQPRLPSPPPDLPQQQPPPDPLYSIRQASRAPSSSSSLRHTIPRYQPQFTEQENSVRTS